MNPNLLATELIGRGWILGGLEYGPGPVYAFKLDGPVIGPLSDIFEAMWAADWYEQTIEGAPVQQQQAPPSWAMDDGSVDAVPGDDIRWLD